MAVILIKPADSASQDVKDLYESRFDGVRIKASPDLGNRIDAKLLPTSVMEADIYIRSAERTVLKHTNMTSDSVMALDQTSSTFLDLVLLTQIRLAILIIPQLPQLINKGFLQDSTRFQTVDWDKRIEDLELEYSDIVGDITPDAPATGSIRARTLLSRSRADD